MIMHAGTSPSNVHEYKNSYIRSPRYMNMRIFSHLIAQNYANAKCCKRVKRMSVGNVISLGKIKDIFGYLAVK